MITLLLLLATGKDINLAVSFLLPSILFYFDLEILDEFLIIVKDHDINLFKKKILEYAKKEKKYKLLKINIKKESEIIDCKVKNTYYLQMYLKLLASKIVKSKYYLTLDADIFLCGNLKLSDLIIDNKCFYQKYKKIDSWIVRSKKYLSFDKVTFSINQTPFLFNNDLVIKLLSDIDVFDAIVNKKCSEYTIYYVYLLKNDIFDLYYFNNNIIGLTISYQTSKIGIESNCIQSRLNMHKKLDDVLLKNIKNSEFKKLKIAMLTVISDDIYFDRYKKAIDIKKNYCKYHNYNFIYEVFNKKDYVKKGGWIKLLKLYEHLKYYDYIFVSDADVVITNRDIRVEDIIIQNFDRKTKLILTTDYNSINSGNMIWKNDDISYDILKSIFDINDNQVRYKIKKPYIPIGIYEQPSIIYLYNSNIKIRDYIKIIPQYILNSYYKNRLKLRNNVLKKIKGITNRVYWNKNDFLIHFAGLNYVKDNSFKINIDNLVSKFTKIYDYHIQIKEGVDFNKIC